MALVQNFKQGQREQYNTHQGIDAEYLLFEKDGKRLLQIDTFGRDTRDVPGKLSQTIQFDAQTGYQLFKILKEHFDFK